MTDRTYRTLLGAALLVVLYFDLTLAMYGIITLLLLEGITNLRLPMIACMVRKCIIAEAPVYEDSSSISAAKFNFESERVWRLVVGVFLLIGYSLVDALWFFPWFMGFAIFGAGLSEVCPVLLAVRWVGFK